ncbi:MAG: SGNH/GDSL hydrolase family protein [Jatrophihabitans sp.]|uniref:SGNH/GDSL hydrolase family protein n=1 Tax=Jatrophihabitans sp. TaxID=1932789 RepID=UPI00390FB03F
MKRAADAALAALGVLVIIAAVYVSKHNGPSDAATVNTGVPANIAPPTGSTRPGSTLSPSASSGTGTSAAAGVREKVVAFLGDEWTAGAGASAKANRFASLLSSHLHVRQRNFGADGAGYGSSSGGYESLVAKVVAAHPDVVIVSGGRNDLSPGHDLTATPDEVDRLFADLRAGLPNAQLIAVAPFWGDSDLPKALVKLGGEVKDAVTAAHGTYLDMEDPIHGHPGLMADDVDPNDQGHAAIAAALEPKVVPLLAG